MYATIVSLVAGDRDRVRDHLLRLAGEDRSLRFAAGVVTDDSVCRYVDAIDFERDLVMGLVSKRGLVIGLVHGAVFDHRGRRHVDAAFSVDAAWRGVGFGTRLMESLLLQASALGQAVVLGQCAVRNRPMRRLFERAGMAMTRSDDEWCARRELGAAPAAGVAA